MRHLDIDFTRTYGAPPQVTARAPGRVNLIGEHTDYTGGLVLPVAIPQTTRVALARRDDRVVRAVSDAVGAGAPVQLGARAPTTRRGGPSALVEFELEREAKRGSWIDYVQGTTFALRERGHRIRGFDVQIASDVPIGAGLSSSAALEVALLRALREAFDLDLDDVALAQVGRAAETDFVGAPVGIMDQMAASLADDATALFIDTRTLDWQRLPLPERGELIVIDSGIAHDHATGDYATRRAECERATKLLGLELLRDASDPLSIDALPQPLARRARHVMTENARVIEAVTCLRTGDVEHLGELLDASHVSLRDDFEVSVPAVDRLVEIAQGDEDVYGARMTGGGFGGAIVALGRRDRGWAAAQRIVHTYDGAGRVLVPESGPEPPEAA
jgi:galactokinase